MQCLKTFPSAEGKHRETLRSCEAGEDPAAAAAAAARTKAERASENIQRKADHFPLSKGINI